MKSLKEVIDQYEALAGRFGEPVALSAFGLTADETTRLFTFLDEDYHISRYVSFSSAQGTQYPVSGNPATHIRIDESIRSLL
jgi:hypothetical protein